MTTNRCERCGDEIDPYHVQLVVLRGFGFRNLFWHIGCEPTADELLNLLNSPPATPSEESEVKDGSNR